MTVKFSIPEEFLEELGKDYMEQKVVRIAFLIRSSKISPNISHMTLVATARVGEEVLRLESYCGDFWGIPRVDTATQERAESLRKVIEEGCAKLLLETRGGIIEKE